MKISALLKSAVKAFDAKFMDINFELDRCLIVNSTVNTATLHLYAVIVQSPSSAAVC